MYLRNCLLVCGIVDQISLDYYFSVLSMNGRLHYRPGLILEVSGEKNGIALTLNAERMNVASLSFDGTLSDVSDDHQFLKGALVLKNTDATNSGWKTVVYNMETEVVTAPQQPFAIEVCSSVTNIEETISQCFSHYQRKR